MSCILYSEKDAVAVVTLNRPESLKPFSRSLRTELPAVMQRAAASAAIRAIVLATGNAFSAGIDLEEMVSASEQANDDGSEGCIPGILAIATIPKPVIAAVNRGVVGVGLSYVLACDFIVIGKGSFMQATFSDLPLVPSGGIRWQLAQRLGHQLAFEMTADGQRLSAERCVQLGLANRMATQDGVLNEAESWAAHFARKPPEVLAATKQVLWCGVYGQIEQSMRLEARLEQKCRLSEEFRNSVRRLIDKRSS